ncbi:MAG TPA: Na+/H+ antiporter NhaA [Gemmatimonadota bacterium]|nr:Na+/H+ antiporter NhaA [Gemmatimonadota bacterium]
MDPKRDHVSGARDGPVTLVEYGDFECPHCRAAHAGVIRLRDERLTGQVRYVFRHLPNRGAHPHAEVAAEASECAAAQGRFWEMHDRLFTSQETLDRETLVRMAAGLELDVERFARELDDHRYAPRVQEDLASAQLSGARATPTFYVDGRRYDGPWDEESLVDTMRKPLGWRLRLLAEQFAGLSMSSGILMLLGVVAALVWANSPWRDSYERLWAIPLTLGAGSHVLTMSLKAWVNDGLIVIFFLVVSLEIRREVTVGAIATPRKAALPIAAAIGGMVAPALIYLAFNAGGGAAHGWGVPMGTDTAFALGLLALLGPRVPLSLRAFVAAAAIADDMGSIAVIALFYTEHIVLASLGAALLLWLLALAMNRARVYAALPYAVIGVLLWLAVLYAGVHPTLAGVLLAFAIPTRSAPSPAALLGQTQSLLQSVEAPPVGEVTAGSYRAAVEALESVVERLLSPAQRLARTLQPWSAYVVLPLFAFANSGIELQAHARDFLEPVSLGIILGLLLGKPLGITAGAWIATRLGLATRPDDVAWAQVAGAGALCGIGFTMAFFIADLTFSDAGTLALTKLSVLAASGAAALAGSAALAVRYARWKRRVEEAAEARDRRAGA